MRIHCNERRADRRDLAQAIAALGVRLAVAILGHRLDHDNIVPLYQVDEASVRGQAGLRVTAL